MDMITKLMFIVGIVMALIWVVVYVVNISNYDRALMAVSKEEYMLISPLIFGFSVMKLCRFSAKKLKYRTVIEKLSSLKGKTYGEFYFSVMKASEINWIWLSIAMGLLLSGLANTKELVILGILMAALGVLYRKTSLSDQMVDRETRLLSEFPAVVSKMTLLVGAGLTMRDAWRQIAESGDGLIYQEMRMVVADKDNGRTDEEAFGDFGKRCNQKDIRKFAISTIQNMQKGNIEQVEFLKDMSDEMWEVKKKLVKKKVEDTKSLLLIPTFMVFIGILIMVMGPMLAGMSAGF